MTKKFKKIDFYRIFMLPLMFLGFSAMFGTLYSKNLELKNYIADIKNDKTSIAFPKLKESIDRDWENIVENGSVSTMAYADGKVSEEDVRDDLIRTINHHGNMRNWRIVDIKAVSQALQFGHNHKNFKVDYKVVLAIMSIESHMNPYATGYNAWNNTTDYGIAQHNSDYITARFSSAVRTEREYKISTVRSATMDKYDPLTGAVATILYLRDNRNYLEAIAKNNKKYVAFKTVIVSYNRGLNGAIYNGNQENPYFNKFMVAYSRIY